MAIPTIHQLHYTSNPPFKVSPYSGTNEVMPEENEIPLNNASRDVHLVGAFAITSLWFVVGYLIVIYVVRKTPSA